MDSWDVSKLWNGKNGLKKIIIFKKKPKSLSKWKIPLTFHSATQDCKTAGVGGNNAAPKLLFLFLIWKHETSGDFCHKSLLIV